MLYMLCRRGGMQLWSRLCASVGEPHQSHQARAFERSTGATMLAAVTDTHATPMVISAAIDSDHRSGHLTETENARRHRCTDKPVVCVLGDHHNNITRNMKTRVHARRSHNGQPDGDPVAYKGFERPSRHTLACVLPGNTMIEQRLK